MAIRGKDTNLRYAVVYLCNKSSDGHQVLAHWCCGKWKVILDKGRLIPTSRTQRNARNVRNARIYATTYATQCTQRNVRNATHATYATQDSTQVHTQYKSCVQKNQKEA